MKCFFVFMVMFCINLNAQSNEFKVNDNGLIYSENSVAKLKYIVDSLNLKFKVCEFNKTFLSCAQTKTNFVNLKGEEALEAKKDLENNMSYLDFKAKYPKANFEENLVVVKSYYGNIRGVESEEISSLELGKSRRKSIILSQKNIDSYKNNFKGKWVFQFYDKTKYSEALLNAFYFVEEFKTKPIADKYARLIQYSDCMVDTTAQVFFDKAKDESGLIGYNPSLPNKALKFNLYVDKVLNKPSFDYKKFPRPYNYKGNDSSGKKLSEQELAEIKIADEQYNVFQKKLKEWESLRLSKLDSLKNLDPSFMLMLNDALVEVKENKSSNNEFEEYVSRYVSKETALELKRSRRVTGGCSMDSRPRDHALNIALLSAETAKWEIFLRSHLNIMNDRFDRVSDGSYAQGTRNTYIKEIEVLDINVLDLILGISLRIENPSKNHYFSSIDRVGRALSESRNPRVAETTILNMISDSELDDYNRILMYYLFENYNYNLVDEKVKKLNQSKLKLAVSNMPDYISSRIILNN